MVQQPILLKTARPGDVGNLATIAAETFRDTFSGMMPVDDLNRYLHEAFLPDKMKLELLDAGNNFTLAYFDTKELVGYSKLRRHQRPSSLVAVNPMEMERLYIKREFQQMKIGSLLL
ncbi:MAG: GNAT family N-acetyltransferase, partial [Bacteroidota bacterium]